MKRSHEKITAVLFALVIFGSLIAAYFYFADGTLLNKVVDIHGDMQTIQTVYAPGDTVTANISFCLYRDVPTTVQWTLRDKRMIFYTPEDISGVGIGCKTNAVVMIETLPTNLTVDTYQFVATVTYHVNGIRDIVKQIKTNEFTVVIKK